MARQLARRRSRERLSGIALAVLGVVVLLVAIFALRNPKGSHGARNVAAPGTSASQSASGSASASASDSGSDAPSSSVSITVSGSPTTMSLAQAQQQPLVVLNNTTITGLAARAAQRFENAGWTVSQVGNLQNVIISTCAYYDPSDPGAKQAAQVLKSEFSTIKRVRPKFSELPSGPIVVVFASGWP